jgi:ankyrin repeat protein
LHEAYWGSHLEIAELLRKKGARIDLLLACYLGDKERIESFLKSEATLVNAADSEGRTLLHWAVAGGPRELAELLLMHDSDSNAPLRRDRFTPLHGAVASGQYDLVALLLKYGAYPNATDGVGWTPLHLAVEPSHRMRWGYSYVPLTPGWKSTTRKISSADDIGNSSLAVNLRILRLLLDNSLTDIDAQTHDWDNTGGPGLHPGKPNWAALHLAVRRGWTDAVKLLLERGASVDLRNQSQRTPLYYAIEGGHKDLVMLLLTHHTPVNTVDYLGETPLSSRF